jgi:hypothetical protein
MIAAPLQKQLLILLQATVAPVWQQPRMWLQLPIVTWPAREMPVRCAEQGTDSMSISPDRHLQNHQQVCHQYSIAHFTVFLTVKVVMYSCYSTKVSLSIILLLSASTNLTTDPNAATSTAAAPEQTATNGGLPAGWKYDGCYREGINGRALQHGQPDTQTNSVENCIATCRGLGYTIAGMEFGAQCFCDKNLYNGAALAAPEKCNMPCPGDNTEMCGAGDYLSVYNIGALTVYKAPTAQKTDLPGSWTYQGCYSDNINDVRALFWQTILTTNNTATSCLTLCQSFGYMAAGVEYGKFLLVTNSRGRISALSKNNTDMNKR